MHYRVCFLASLHYVMDKFLVCQNLFYLEFGPPSFCGLDFGPLVQKIVIDNDLPFNKYCI